MSHSPGSQFAEVSFGLEGVAGQSSEHSTGQNQGLENSGVFIEGHCTEGQRTTVKEVCGQRVPKVKTYKSYSRAVATETASSRVWGKKTFVVGSIIFVTYHLYSAGASEFPCKTNH